MDMIGLISQAEKLEVSDVHITSGIPPVFRLHGTLYPINATEILSKLTIIDPGEIKKLTPQDTERLAREIMSQNHYDKFQEKGELDFSFSVPGTTRVRVNAFKQRGSIALALRLLNTNIKSFQELGLPEVVTYLANRPNGLLLVTGPTGSGKSTTLAVILDLINREKRLHILTLEDPIEYLHKHNMSMVNQREINHDTTSFAAGLRAALREDPDVILVGEMRDLETITIAVTAAETGHLVMATLHTSSAAETIDRVVDVFPPAQQQQIRVQLANSLEGIISQQLIPRIDRPGRVLALEILVSTAAVKNLIREGKTYQILTQLQTGIKYGMQTLDMSLRNLYRKKIISKEEVLNRANEPKSILENLGG